MTLTDKQMTKAPFPWFGGKSQAAPLVWSLLGDVDHYVEPFAGALGVGLGFGMQGIVKEFISGLVLLFDKLIRSMRPTQLPALLQKTL